jgi:GTPase SAR1 family protein
LKANKVVIVGLWGVGKTSILSKFLRNEFNNENASTFSAQFRNANVKINEQGE